MDRKQEAEQQADQLGEVIDQIDHGELSATPTQRAFIAGAREALGGAK